jgi:hypothetical protein
VGATDHDICRLSGSDDAALIAAAATAHPVPWALIVLTVGFGVAALFALWSAQPVAWELSGNQPCMWIDDVRDGDSLHNGFATMADHYDRMIGTNEAIMASNANWLRGAMVAVIFTLIIAAVTFAIEP